MHINERLANHVHSLLNPILKNKIWLCNLCSKDVPQVCNNRGFWYEVLSEWSHINFNDPQTYQELLLQSIWYNSWIKKKNNELMKPIEELLEMGIFNIGDIVTHEGKFKSFKEMCAEHGHGFEKYWLWYQSLLKSVPKSWFTFIHYDPIFEDTLYSKICNVKKTKRCDLRFYFKT